MSSRNLRSAGWVEVDGWRWCGEVKPLVMPMTIRLDSFYSDVAQKTFRLRHSRASALNLCQAPASRYPKAIQSRWSESFWKSASFSLFFSTFRFLTDEATHAEYFQSGTEQWISKQKKKNKASEASEREKEKARKSQDQTARNIAKMFPHSKDQIYMAMLSDEVEFDLMNHGHR
jgi:hypothetical protein